MNQLQIHLKLVNAIYQYLDKQFPIKGNTIYVDEKFGNFRATPFMGLAVDREINEIFGLKEFYQETASINFHNTRSHFWNWTKTRIGNQIVIDYADRIVHYKDGEFHNDTEPAIIRKSTLIDSGDKLIIEWFHNGKAIEPLKEIPNTITAQEYGAKLFRLTR